MGSLANLFTPRMDPSLVFVHPPSGWYQPGRRKLTAVTLPRASDKDDVRPRFGCVVRTASSNFALIRKAEVAEALAEATDVLDVVCVCRNGDGSDVLTTCERRANCLAQAFQVELDPRFASTVQQFAPRGVQCFSLHVETDVKSTLERLGPILLAPNTCGL